jgi:type IV secretion system protein VirB10
MNGPVEPATTETAESVSKEDPETLVLRARPARAVRFRRSVIVGLASAALLGVSTAAWLAFRPRHLQLVSHDEDAGAPATLPADALSGLPATYATAPPLGPPLPGDLGRPMLEYQRSLATHGPAQATDDPAAQAAQAERQRATAERKAARESGVMTQLASTSRPIATAAPTSEPSDATSPLAASAGNRPALDPERDPNAQQHKIAFLDGDRGGEDVNPHSLVKPVSPWTLQAGTVIAASLITGLNSDLPGLVTAQVTENVYDSVTGRTVLVPQGSRLLGSYDSVIAFGQSRALVVWQRVILPDGSSIRIDNLPATDAAGYAGLADRVDLHTWQLLKGVVLSTLLGVGSELSFGEGESDLVRAVRESAQQSGARAGDQLVSKNLNVQPTIRVRPGWPVRVVVQKDIVMRPWPMGKYHR